MWVLTIYCDGVVGGGDTCGGGGERVWSIACVEVTVITSSWELSLTDKVNGVRWSGHYTVSLVTLMNNELGRC